VANKTKSELEIESGHSEGAKIDFVEGFMVLLLAATADAVELVVLPLTLIPVLGQLLWIVAYGFGLVVSGIIILWSTFRGINGVFFKNRVFIVGGGAIGDAALGGFVPLRTVALLIMIILNNRFESKNIARIAELIK